MKMNYWLVLGVMVAVSATAQNNTNSLPPIPPPAIGTPAAAPESAPVETNAAPAKKTAVKKAKKHVEKKHAAKKSVAAVPKKVSFTEPSVALVPGPAEVVVSNLNVRGQAGLKGEFIAHITKGDSVTVISEITLDKHKADEPAQWAKIALPASVSVWVDSKFIDATSKTVLPKKLNVRAGPSENYSVLGVLERGTPITETGSKGGWTKIEAPTNAYAFVAAMYLKQEASGTEAANPPPSTETQPMETNNAVPPAPAPTTVPEAQPIVSETPANPPVAPEANPTPEPAPAVTDTNLPPPAPRIVTHEGSVRHVSSIIAPTTYELYDPSTLQNIDYLYSPTTNLDLSHYDGCHIVVTGEEGLAQRWKDTPVLTIQRIIVISAPAPEPKYQSAPSNGGHR